MDHCFQWHFLEHSAASEWPKCLHVSNFGGSILSKGLAPQQRSVLLFPISLTSWIHYKQIRSWSTIQSVWTAKWAYQSLHTCLDDLEDCRLLGFMNDSAGPQVLAFPGSVALRFLAPCQAQNAGARVLWRHAHYEFTSMLRSILNCLVMSLQPLTGPITGQDVWEKTIWQGTQPVVPVVDIRLGCLGWIYLLIVISSIDF